MKAVGYVRISQEDENIENQINAIKRFCEERNIELVEIFKDIGISGSVRPSEREGFKKMMEFCKSNNINLIILYDLSRFSRDLISGIYELYNLINNGFNFMFAGQDFLNYIDDPLMKKKIISDFLWFAELYREDIRKRTREALRRLKEQGKKLGRPNKIKENQYALIINLLNQGYKKKQICQMLNISYSTLWRFLKKYELNKK